MQKVHQSSEYRDELNAFLIIAFVFTFVVDILELYALPLIQEMLGI